MLSAYDSVGYPNRGSNDPFPFLFMVFFVILVFVLGCCCGWKLHAFMTRVGQRRVGEIIEKFLGIKLR